MDGELIGSIIVGIALVNLYIQFVASYVVYPLYMKFGWFRGYYHNIMGLHSPDTTTILVCNHGRERHAICKYCGKGIKEDDRKLPSEWR